MSARIDHRERSVLDASSGDGDGRMRVLIADPDGLARRMIRTALYDLDRVAIVLSTGDAQEALEFARYYRPTVMIIDTTLVGAGAELVATVLAMAPETRVVTISIDDDRAAIAALRAGAVGHIEKDVVPKDLARLVIRAAEGEAIVPQRLLMPLLDLVREVPDAGWRPLQSRLTTREWQIIELIAEGASTQRIAERLVLSPSTVYTHVKSLLRKLGVHSRRDAVAAAERLRREEAQSRKPPCGTPANSSA
ncbi:MAG: response regulator transcription factor [Solirubrobacterales bacterium]|nr:response regulator transcription factor [Solirubrobacterales bacterium]MBV9714182.1 response regulator transcription factor [Solirubrobacterales bacterium]